MNVRSPTRGATPGDAARPRLYAVTHAVRDPGPLRAALAEIVAAADVAAVLLDLADADERGLVNAVKALAPAVQAAGTALVVAGRPGIVARGGADGAHLSGGAALREALSTLKPAFIAGAGGLMSRHDAMRAAEAGADYVMFGEPGGDGRCPAFDAVADRVAWWAEVFEVPCVAFAPGLDDIAALAAAGADFVAVGGDALFGDPRGPGAAATEAAARLAAARRKPATTATTPPAATETAP